MLAQPSQQFLDGTTVVVLEFPENFDFGIDCKVFKTGNMFQGIKLIPPGLHLCYYSTGEELGGIRIGFFFEASDRQLIVKKWDRKNEDLMENIDLSEESFESLCLAVQQNQLDKNLGAYPMDQYGQWTNLTNYITSTVLNRCMIYDCAKIFCGGNDNQFEDSRFKTIVSRKKKQEKVVFSEENAVSHFPEIGQTIQFTNLQIEPPSSLTIAELSKFYIDGSTRLEEILKNNYLGVWTEILGELQLSFVSFLMLYSFNGLKQWEHLIHLLCTCENAMHSNPELFLQFIRILEIQMNLIGDDFFDDEQSENFLTVSLNELFQNVFQSGSSLDNDTPQNNMPLELIEKTKELLKFVQSRFGLFKNIQLESNVIPTKDLKAFINFLQTEFYGEDQPTLIIDNEVIQNLQPNELQINNHASNDMEISAFDDTKQSNDKWSKFDQFIEHEKLDQSEYQKYLSLVSKKYPEFFLNIQDNEDIFMAAARILETHEGGFIVVQQVQKFLESDV